MTSHCNGNRSKTPVSLSLSERDRELELEQGDSSLLYSLENKRSFRAKFFVVWRIVGNQHLW